MKKTILAFVASAGLLFATSSANATVIDFEEIGGPGTEFLGRPIESQGYSFYNNCDPADPIDTDCFFQWADDSVNNADSGGRTLIVTYERTTTTLTKIGGDLFDLVSMDFADVYNTFDFKGTNYNAPLVQILVEGTFEDGSTIERTVELDLLPGLETFEFNWKELAKVTWTDLNGELDTDPIIDDFAESMQYDNIVVYASASEPGPDVELPEPAPLALLGLGLLGLAAARRKRA